MTTDDARGDAPRSNETRTIERQQADLERLRALLADQSFADDLRDTLLATAVTATIAAPKSYRDAMTAIVETAAEVLNAQAAALFTLDEEREELVFEVALGGQAEVVKQFRVPLGHGIAGYVAATGQPIAIADAERDPRFARDIGQAVSYVPHTILCVPLFLDAQIIGVLELLDKADGQQFSTHDMEVLGRFATLAALAIDQSRLTHDLRRLFRTLLGDLVAVPDQGVATRRFADNMAAYAGDSEALRLAELVHEVCHHGDRSGRLALDVLGSIARFLQPSSV